jgi:hypothetical protein
LCIKCFYFLFNISIFVHDQTITTLTQTYTIMDTTKKYFIEALRSSRKLFAYVPMDKHSGMYVKLNKSDVLRSLSKYNDDHIFTNVRIEEDSIWVN